MLQTRTFPARAGCGPRRPGSGRPGRGGRSRNPGGTGCGGLLPTGGGVPRRTRPRGPSVFMPLHPCGMLCAERIPSPPDLPVPILPPIRPVSASGNRQRSSAMRRQWSADRGRTVPVCGPVPGPVPGPASGPACGSAAAPGPVSRHRPCAGCHPGGRIPPALPENVARRGMTLRRVPGERLLTHY